MGEGAVMGTVNLNPGFIYVMQQSDFFTGAVSDQLKIGIVKDPRTPVERLKDHQTGNSRKLTIVAEYHAEEVSAAEALVHRRLAKHRVHGEWFVSQTTNLSDSFRDEIDLAIRETSSLANLEMVAATYKGTRSNGKIRKASDSELEMTEELRHYERVVRDLQGEQAQIKVDLSSDCVDYAGIVDLCEWTYHEGKSGLSMTKLKTLDPKVHSSLLHKVVRGNFTPDVPRGKSPAKPVFPSQIRDLVSRGRFLERTRSQAEKHHRYLELEEEISQFETVRDEIRLRLMIAVGECDSIENVATWIRKSVDSPVSGHAALLEEKHPELFEKAQVASKDRVGFRVRPYMSYPRP